MQSIAQIITMKCMGKCNYCMYGTKLNEIKEVPLEDLLNYYRQIPDEFDVKITGGEPLQPNNLERTLTFIRELKKTGKLMHYQINTNGAWGVPEEILNDELASVQVSLDGPREYQEKNYGHQYYDTLIDTIKAVAETHRGWVMMVVTLETKQYVNYVRELCKTMGIEFRAQWASPVDKAEQFCLNNKFKEFKEICEECDFYLYNLDMNNPVSPGEDWRPPECRNMVAFCGHRIDVPNDAPPDIPPYIGYGITADGKIINCPILSDIETGLTIYNTKPTETHKIFETLNKTVADKTCQFPEGFKEYWSHASIEDKEASNSIIMDFEKEHLHELFGINF